VSKILAGQGASLPGQSRIMSGGFGAFGYSGHADLFVSLIEHAKAVIESTRKGIVKIERQGDGSFIVRISWTRSGKDVAGRQQSQPRRRGG
jgi:hypothetical protein